MVRGFLHALVEHSLLERVQAELDPAARAIAKAPPLPSEWVDGRVLFELNAVVYDLFGEEVLARVSLDGNRAGISRLVRFGVESTLRLFGVSPATMFARIGQLSASTTRGIDYTWTADGPRKGTLRICYPSGDHVPHPSWLSARGGLRMVFDFCKVAGTVGPPQLVDARGNASDYLLRW